MKSRDELIVRPSFKMAFGGGEIWFEQLDALYDFTELVMDKFRSDVPVFSRPSMPSVIAVNLKETLVTDELAELMARSFSEAGRSVTRVAFVGVDGDGRGIIKKYLRKYPAQYAYKLMSDFEKSKEWLVGEENN